MACCTDGHLSQKFQYKDFRVWITEQNIWKDLEETNGDYQGKVVLKPHSDHSDKRRIPEFIGDIQAIIENDPSKSIKSTSLSQVMKDKRKNWMEKLLNKLKNPLQLNMPCFFSDEKNFCQEQTTIVLLCHHKMYP